MRSCRFTLGTASVHLSGHCSTEWNFVVHSDIKLSLYARPASIVRITSSSAQNRTWISLRSLEAGMYSILLNFPDRTNLLPIWLIILNVMSSCRTASKYWNQGLISIPGRGTCTEKTMSLASSVFAKGSSKLWTCWHRFDPHGTSQPRALWRFMHLVAKYRMALVGLGAMEKENKLRDMLSVQIFGPPKTLYAS